MQSTSSYHVLIRTQDFVWTLSQVFAVLNGSPLFIWVKWTAFAVLTRIPYSWKGKYRACVSQCILTSFFLHWRLVSATATQITCNANDCPIVRSQWHGREHQRSALLALSEWKHRSAIVPLIKINNAESVLMSWRHEVCLTKVLSCWLPSIDQRRCQSTKRMKPLAAYIKTLEVLSVLWNFEFFLDDMALTDTQYTMPNVPHEPRMLVMRTMVDSRLLIYETAAYRWFVVLASVYAGFPAVCHTSAINIIRQSCMYIPLYLVCISGYAVMWANLFLFQINLAFNNDNCRVRLETIIWASFPSIV